MSLDKFKKFQKEKIELVVSVKRIWGYTRVSSKEQSNNYSLTEQEQDLKLFAKKNDYELEQILGGSYESASGDFSRKEFKRLIDEVRKSKKRPFAIAIKFISRFSRTGDNAIGIVQELVEKMGVHLIETSTGLTTENEFDRLEVYKKLLEAKKENLDRLEKTLPGMKALLKDGNWLGKVPRGYTLRGRKVTDYSKLQEHQEILINEEGELLKKAWKWKLMGERDFVIMEKLENLGLKISKQSLSNMWRKPFYCGVIVNALLDEPAKGKWKPIVSETDFWKIQEELDKNKVNSKKEFIKSKVHNKRPLTGFLRCECGEPLTSYEVNKKKLHYYKCQKCKEVSFNAITTTKSKSKGLNNLFEDLLANYTLNNQFIEPLKLQLKKLFDTMNNEGLQELKSLEAKKVEVEKNLENLELRNISNLDFSQVTYKNFKNKFKSELELINEKIEDASQKISNHKNFIDKSIAILQNTSKIWSEGDIENKIRIQKLVFPEGLSIKAKNRQYLTNKVNQLFVLVSSIKGLSGEIGNEKVGDDADLSPLVAGTGLEPVTLLT
ncbi:hypothetical protein DI487_10270 [Flavobacterium sediminis]|uniref:Resolvase/invertase-type recombinase catalytic domain-containing protein n=1 Tax=Flavobacterium sediminis TaxID=2201181 RepID=A0A2U8QVH3_9FLAO|nr:recombinase family protein [Flavobacterium sediminis]AWM14197.1 hypothetical protein DI487_10270 [Flavobacterium sediminis]